MKVTTAMKILKYYLLAIIPIMIVLGLAGYLS